MLIEQMGLQGVIEETPKLHRPVDTVSTAINAVVNVTPQLLRPISQQLKSIQIPNDLTENAKTVLLLLDTCFRKAGYIKEGIVEDIIWGFVEVCGTPGECVAYGLIDLYRAGYIKFIGPDGGEVNENGTYLYQCWLKYTDTLLDLYKI